jgi:hypothetical protein
MTKSIEFSIGSVELTISFDTVDELKTALGQVEEIKKVLKENLSEASTEAPKAVRKDLQGFFDYQDGKLVMIKAPKTKADKVCLALYALDPDSAGIPPKEIARVSRVQNPSNSVLHNQSYKKYFRQLQNGDYVLTDKGLTHVTADIIGAEKEQNQVASTYS